jgi:hypothetical protein
VSIILTDRGLKLYRLAEIVNRVLRLVRFQVSQPPPTVSVGRLRIHGYDLAKVGDGLLGLARKQVHLSPIEVGAATFRVQANYVIVVLNGWPIPAH